VLADPDWAASLRLSGEIAAGVTVLALALGVPAALGLRRLRGWAGIALQTFFLSPLMVPTMVIGLALLRLFSAVGIPLSPATIRHQLGAGDRHAAARARVTARLPTAGEEPRVSDRVQPVRDTRR
jgi:ABC-type sulfate transport system permease component